MPIKLLQKRRISGKGILRFSPGDKGRKYYRLYLDVIRRPKNEFQNLNWNPPRGKYAFITFLKQNRVLSRFALESLNEELQFIPDVAGQMQLMAKCSIDTHNTSFVNLGVSLGAVPITVNNPLSEFLALDIGWDEARIICYADTAIEVALWGQDYDVCKEPDKREDPGGEPVPLPSPISPGTPIEDISPPYDENTSDDGLTEPFPSDGLETPPSDYPKGDQCEVWRVRVRILSTDGQIFEAENLFYAPIRGYVYNTSDNTLYVLCQGRSNVDIPCGQLDYGSLAFSQFYESHEVLFEEPI